MSKALRMSEEQWREQCAKRSTWTNQPTKANDGTVRKTDTARGAVGSTALEPVGASSGPSTPEAPSDHAGAVPLSHDRPVAHSGTSTSGLSKAGEGVGNAPQVSAEYAHPSQRGFRPLQPQAVAGPLTSKYRNQKTDGYASKKEAKRALALKLMQEAGQIRNLREQVEYLLIPPYRDADGKTVERAAKYRADFVYEEWPSWNEVVEDCKGMRTTEYVLKRKMMLFVHGIRIRET